MDAAALLSTMRTHVRPILRPRRLLRVAAGWLAVCALLPAAARGDGPVVAWGGTVTPPAVDGTDGTASALSAGWRHVCAIQAGTGIVVCWGNSTNFGGDFPSLPRRVTQPPGAVTGIQGTAFAIASGYNHACAIQEQSRFVECWGDNTFNQGATPDAIDGDGTASAIAAGGDHTCAIQAETGGVVCWGQNINLQNNAPNSVNGSEGTAIGVAAGQTHGCAIRAETGGVVCWGGVGDSDPEDLKITPPPAVNGEEGTASAIASFWNHTCAIQAETGGVVCWGQGGPGELVPPPSVDGTAGTATAIATGYERSCAIRASDGGMVCWASAGGDGKTPPPEVDGIAGSAFAMDTGWVHECAIENGTGAVRCWGTPGFDRADVPDSVNGTAGVARDVVASGEHACAIQSGTDEVVCWGLNDELQSTPPAGLTATKIALGPFHGCAIERGSSQVVCWGDDQGSGPAADGPAIPPPGLGPVLDIAAGLAHSCAIPVNPADPNDSAYRYPICWGTGEAADPDAVFEDLMNFNGAARSITAGWFHTCIIGNDNTSIVWCWPQNGFRPEYFPPLPVFDLDPSSPDPYLYARQRFVTAGDINTCSIRTTTRLLDCFGVDDFEQVSGVPPALLASATLTPNPIGEPVATLAVGERHVCAVIAATNEVECWGEDAFQQTFPPSGLAAEVLAAGSDYTLAIVVPEPHAPLLGLAAGAVLAGLARRRQSR